MSDTTTVEQVSFQETDDANSSTAVTDKQSIFDRLKEIITVSEVLRILGAFAVIASMSLFLLQGWSDGNDMQRYLMVLGQTGLLCGSGIVLSFAIKENKGARLFFGLSLVSAVANFTILGALIYSMLPLDFLSIEYPSMAKWEAVNPGQFWPVCAGAVVLLAILSRFGFSIFARSVSGSLTVSFLLLNSLLLIPVRSSLYVSVLAVAALWAAAMLVKRMSQHEKVVFTAETRFAFGLLFLPGLIIIARAISLYNVDEVLLISLSGMAYFALRSLVARMHEPTFMRRITEIVQFCLGINVSLQIVDLIQIQQYNINPAVFSMLVIGFTWDQIRRSDTVRWKSLILNITAFALVFGNVALATFSDSLFLKMSSLLVCLVLFAFIVRIETSIGAGYSKLAAISGTAISILLIIYQLIVIAELSDWMMIGLIGMTLIIGASLYERYGLSILTRKS